jgi:hypothetical protein
MESFSKQWQSHEAKAKTMGLAEAADAIGEQPALIREVVNSLSEGDLREEMEMFGDKAARGA